MFKFEMLTPVSRLFLLPLAVAVSFAQPTIFGVTNGASYSGNVTGSSDGLYPSTLPLLGATPTSGPISYSVMFIAARFSTSFDIAPNAKTFSVVATSEGGAAVIDIDPVQGTWQATLSVPTSAARAGDFSGSGFSSVLDFTNCNGNGCRQFPNNLIPISYFDPIFVKAENLIPLPNLPVAKSPAATFSASGTFSGTHFDTASTPLGAFCSFGGFIQIPHAGPSSRTATFRLYVDGVLITARDVNYPVL